MILGRPASHDVIGLQVDHCHRRVCPQTHVEALAFLIDAARVREGVVVAGGKQVTIRALFRGGGILIRQTWLRLQQRARVGAQWDVGDSRGGREFDSGDAVAPKVRYEKCPARGSDGQAGRYRALFNLSNTEFLMLAEISAVEFPRIDDFLARTAAIEPAAIGREFKPIKALIDIRMSDDLTSRQVHDCDDMLTVAGMENCRKAAAGMNSNVYRKITKSDLAASRTKRPLIGEQRGTVCLRAGEDPPGRLPRRRTGRRRRGTRSGLGTAGKKEKAQETGA